MADPETYDFNPYNLPRELKEAIGLVLSSASQTENVLNMMIGGCLGIDAEYSMALTAHMTLPLKMSVLRSVAEIRIDDLDDLDELDALLDQIDQALQKRHQYAHYGWCRSQTSGEIFIAKTVARTRLEGGLVRIECDAVLADAAMIYGSGMNLMKFMLDRDLSPPFPTQPRPRGHKSKAARKRRRKL
jgi:hypothetical protein